MDPGLWENCSAFSEPAFSSPIEWLCRQRNWRSNCQHPLDHRKSKRVPEKHSHQPTTTSSSISTAFFRENAFATIRRQKILFKGLLNPETWIFMLQNKQTFLIGKNVLIVMVPILFNKDVFEPSYSDLKFTVWIHSYIFTNNTFIIITNNTFSPDNKSDTLVWLWQLKTEVN